MNSHHNMTVNILLTLQVDAIFLHARLLLKYVKLIFIYECFDFLMLLHYLTCILKFCLIFKKIAHIYGNIRGN